jgi:hypothetical protein
LNKVQIKKQINKLLQQANHFENLMKYGKAQELQNRAYQLMETLKEN